MSLNPAPIVPNPEAEIPETMFEDPRFAIYVTGVSYPEQERDELKGKPEFTYQINIDPSDYNENGEIVKDRSDKACIIHAVGKPVMHRERDKFSRYTGNEYYTTKVEESDEHKKGGVAYWGKLFDLRIMAQWALFSVDGDGKANNRMLRALREMNHEWMTWQEGKTPEEVNAVIDEYGYTADEFEEGAIEADDDGADDDE